MEANYDFWHAALDGATDLMINQNEPQSGFYRMKDGRPVAIWVDDGEMVISVADRMALPHNHEDIWTRCCTRPVTQDQYNDFLETGVWHDQDEDMVETLGDNIRDAHDPETLQQMIEQLAAAAEKYKKLNDDNEVAKAASLRNRLLELRARADKLRVELKAPILEAGRRVDGTWQPIVKRADDIALGLRKAMEAFATARLIKAREEEARRQAEDAAAPPEPVKDQVRSGYGRAASVRSRLVVTEITDALALFTALKDSSDLRALMIKLAQYRIDKGFDVPGVRVEEQAVVI